MPDGGQGGGGPLKPPVSLHCWSGQTRREMPLPKEMPPSETTEDHVLSILCVRRAREELFGVRLFSDPAWDILLELFGAKLGQRNVELDELARSIEVPRSTTARWITILAENGLVVSLTDAASSSELLVELSPEGCAKMKRLLNYWGSAFRSI